MSLYRSALSTVSKSVHSSLRVPASLSGVAAVPEWLQVRANREWGDYSGRDGAVACFFGDSVFLFGGWRSGPYANWNNRNTTNEIWRSDDFGATWTLAFDHDEAATDRPSRRHTPGSVVCTIGSTRYWYIIGGDIEDATYSTGHSDVWRTADGVTWEKMAEHGTPGWDGRNIISAGYLGGKLYVLGGATGPGSTGPQMDMWESSDEGETWTETIGSLGFAPMAAGELITLGSKMYLVAGGYTGSTVNTVRSFNGTTWTEELPNGHGQFIANFYNNQALFQNKIWHIQGENTAGDNLAGTYYSTNGQTWVSITSPFTATHATALASHANGVLLCTGNSMSRESYWLGSAVPTPTIDPLESLGLAQLLLKDGEPAHYTEAERPNGSHLLKDYSVDYRSGDPIPGYAPQDCLTGNGSTWYAVINGGSENIGSWAGAMEIEFSFKAPATNAARTGIISHGNGSNWTYALTIESSYKLGWRHDFTLLHTGSITMSPSTWYRIKVVKTGSAGAWVINFYIDGVLDSTLNTADNAQIFASPFTYLLRVPNTWHCTGSIADLRLTYNSKNYHLPLCEGVNTALHWYETIGATSGKLNGVLVSTSMWGTKTTEESGAKNWILEYGGYRDGDGVLVPAYGGTTAADGNTVNLLPSKFSVGTIHCDPLSLGGGLGLESALTPTTDRNAASSGTRRRRAQYGFVDRLAAKATAISSNYFND